MPDALRNQRIDTIKGLLIFLVVFGHAIEPLRQGGLVTHTYKFIYTFHMPAFIFLSGMFSKSTLGRGDLSKIIRNVVVPLIVFSAIYEGVHVYYTGSVSGYLKGLAPNWILWFLLSLIIWRLVTPLLVVTRWPFLLSLAIAVGCLSSKGTGYYLSLGRTFTFLPFFVLGHQYGHALFKRIEKKVSVAAAVVAVGVLVFTWWIADTFATSLLYGSNSFGRLDLTFSKELMERSILYIVSSVAAVAVFTITPSIQILASWGRRSLVIYAWHGLLVKELYRHTKLGTVAAMPVWALLLCLVISLAMTMGLSTGAANRITDLLCAPVRFLLLRKG